MNLLPRVHAHVCDYPTIMRCNTRQYRQRVAGYCLKTNGGPLTRSPLRSTATSTRSAILMNGMPLFHAIVLAVEGHRAFNLA